MRKDDAEILTMFRFELRFWRMTAAGVRRPCAMAGGSYVFEDSPSYINAHDPNRSKTARLSKTAQIFADPIRSIETAPGIETPTACRGYPVQI